MTRQHRTAHRWIWPVIAVIVGALFVAALVMRPPPAQSATAFPALGNGKAVR